MPARYGMTHLMPTRLCTIFLVLVLLNACASTTSQSSPTLRTTNNAITAEAVPSVAPLQTGSSGLGLPPGFHAEIYASGLHNPTAMAFGPDGKLYLTQLNGGENDGTGQVVVVDKPGVPAHVVLDGLFKPTGLVWRGSDLFLVAGRDVLQTSSGESGQLRPPTSIVHDLPFNTRSEGQIDLLPDGRLLFEASGLVQDPQSGRLFTLVPGEQPKEFAKGLKNAYGHAVDSDSGQIYTTDIGDDPMDGRPPPEEINAVIAGGDYGWPLCYAERLPSTDRGATTASCGSTQPSLVTFPPRSTPTGLTFYDGLDFPSSYRDSLYVTLWNGNPPEVQRIALQRNGEQVTGVATPFINGMKQPIDLLPNPNNGLLVLDFTAGVVYRIQAQSR